MEQFEPASIDGAEPIDGVHLTPLQSTDRMSMQAFEIEADAVVPEHEHHQEQFGIVYRGELTFVVDETEILVEAGDSFAIPGGEPHAAENTGDSLVRGFDVFAPPRKPDFFEE